MRLFKAILLLMLIASIIPTVMVGWLSVSDTRELLVRDAQELAQEHVKQLRLKLGELLVRAHPARAGAGQQRFFSQAPTPAARPAGLGAHPAPRGAAPSPSSPRARSGSGPAGLRRERHSPHRGGRARGARPGAARGPHRRALLGGGAPGPPGHARCSPSPSRWETPSRATSPRTCPCGRPEADPGGAAGLQRLRLRGGSATATWWRAGPRSESRRMCPTAARWSTCSQQLAQAQSPDTEHFHVGNFGAGKDAHRRRLHAHAPAWTGASSPSSPWSQAYRQVESMEKRILLGLGGAILVALRAGGHLLAQPHPPAEELHRRGAGDGQGQVRRRGGRPARRTSWASWPRPSTT